MVNPDRITHTANIPGATEANPAAQGPKFDPDVAQLPQLPKKDAVQTREFGLLCAPRAVAGSQHDGGSGSRSASYLLNILNDQQSFQELAMILLGDDEGQKIAGTGAPLISHLELMQELTKKSKSSIPTAWGFQFRRWNLAQGNKPPSWEPAKGIELAKEILKECSSREDRTCYLESGYAGNPGHFAVLKVRHLEGSKVEMRILNRGDGIEAHNAVEGSPTQRQISSPPFEVDLKDSTGHQLVQELASLHENPRPNEICPSALDLYGRLMSYGTPMPETPESGRAAKMQTTGNCPASSLNAMIADILVHEGHDLDAYRKLMLVIRTYALLQEFETDRRDSTDALLFHEALDSLLSRAAKLGPEACNTALIENKCMEMRRQLLQDKEKRATRLAEGGPMPTEDLATPPKLEATLEGCHPNIEHAQDNVKFTHSEAPQTCEELVSDLGRFLTKFIRLEEDRGESLSNGEKLQLALMGSVGLRALLRSVPSTEDCNFWRGMTSETAAKLIHELNNATKLLDAAAGAERSDRERLAEITALALDMAAEAADHVDALKFTNKYTLALKVLSFDDKIITDPEAVRSVERVQKNFARRAVGRKVLFGKDMDLVDGVEGRYLIGHIISKQSFKSLKKANLRLRNLSAEEAKGEVAREYFVQHKTMFNYETAQWPGRDFIDPITSLHQLSDLLIQTAACRGTPPQPKAPSLNSLVDDLQNHTYSCGVNKNCTTNKVGVIYAGDFFNDAEDLFSSTLHKELCCLESGRELRALNTLDWILRPYEFQNLQDPRVRDRLEALLFGLESPLHAVRSHRDTLISQLEALRATCERHAVEDPINSAAAIAWCCSAINRFRYHLRKENAAPDTVASLNTGDFLKGHLEKHREGLTSDQQSDLHRAIALSYLGAEEIDAEDFVSSLVWARTLSPTVTNSDWSLLLSISQERAESLSKELESHSEFLTGLANESLGEESAYTWTVDPKDPHRLLGRGDTINCSIDLFTGQITNDKGSVFDLLPALQQNSDYSELVQGKGAFPVNLTGGNFASSFDETYAFELEKTPAYCKVLKVFKKLAVAGQDTAQLGEYRSEIPEPFQKYSLIAAEHLLGHRDVQPWLLPEHNKTSYLFLVDRKDPSRAILCEEDKNFFGNKSVASFQLLELREGCWHQAEKQLSFQGQNDVLLSKAIPTESTSSEMAFLYERGIATKIIVPSIGLSFSATDQLWLCDQHPDYQLMRKKSVEALSGYPHAFVLQHVRTKKERVLLPAFTWKELEKSLRDQPVVNTDVGDLLNNSPFVCDVESGKLVSNDPATHLYLALIFRAQRDYTRAMEHLKLSQHPGEDGDLEIKIAELLKTFPIKTSRAAAFDIHFLLRMEGHQGKFTRESFTAAEKNPLWEEAVRIYNSAESRHREGFSGIHESLQVPEWVLASEPTKEISPPHAPQSYRLLEVEKKAQEMLKDSAWAKGDWNRTWETSPSRKGEDTTTNLENGDANREMNFPWIESNFLTLVRWAVDDDPAKRGRVRSHMLTYLSQHEPEGDALKALALLLVVLNNPKAFQAWKDPARITRKEARKIFRSWKLCRSKPCTLLPPLGTSTRPLRANPLKPQLLAPAAVPSWTPPNKDEATWKKQPCKKIYEAHFSHKREKLYADMASPFESWDSKDRLEKNMISGLQEAFGRLRKTERSVHNRGENFNAGKLKTALDNRADELNDAINDLEEKLQTLLNTAPQETVNQLRALQASEETGTLGLSHVLEAMLKRSHAPLLRRNPTLTKTELSKIYQKMIHHQSLTIERHQVSEGQKILGDKTALTDVETQRLGEVLHRERNYNPGKYPEILAYAAATGRDPKPKQLDILIKLFDAMEAAIDTKAVEHLLLKFAAGGGKTSVLIPILAMFLTTKGKLPVITNTSDLYYQSLQELPSMLRGAFEQQLEVIDRDVQHRWTTEELQELKTKLQQWHKHQGRALLIKSSSWHSLNSAGKIELYWATSNKKDTDARERAGLIGEILGYFKENAVRLEDECHLSSDPHQETIRAFEIGQLVPMRHHEIYYKAYRAAARVAEPGAAITPEMRKAITKECAKAICKDPAIQALPWVEEYLKNDSSDRPPELLKLEKTDPETADLVILAKNCLHNHHPHTGALTLGKEYGASIHEGDMTAAPRHDGRPSGAHFVDTMLVSALTTQKALEEGIPVRDLPVLVAGLRDEHDRSLMKGNSVTVVERRLRKVFKDDGFKMDRITDAELSQRLSAQLRNHWLRKRYLMRHALRQIRYPGRAIKSTPAEMSHGFNLSIQLSATPGLAEIYSVLLRYDEKLDDKEFVAEVLAVLIERNANGLIMQDRSTPRAFFGEIAKKSPEDFTKLRACLDRGGLFANCSPEEIAQATVDTGNEQGLQSRAITWQNEQVIKVGDQPREGEAIPEVAVFPLQQTTGRDYPDLDYQAHGALLLGRKVALNGVVQAAMRERKLLIPGAQTLFWCVMEDLWRGIGSDKANFDVEEAIKWTLANQAEEFRSRVVARAYQGIDAEYHSIAWDLIRKGDKRGRTMLEVLCPAPQTRPWDLYAKNRELHDTVDVLNDYAQGLERRLKLKAKELPQEARDRIETIIDQTKALVDQLEVPSSTSLKQEALREQENEEEKEMERTADLGTERKIAVETYSAKDRIESPKTMNLQFSPLRIKGIKRNKVPEILLPEACRLSPREDWKRVVKPLSHVLMKQDRKGKWTYYALTEAGARFYVRNIREGSRGLSAMVVALGGTVLEHTQDITKADCNAQLNGVRFRQVVPLLEMLANREFDPDEFVATLKELDWSAEDYKAFCEKVRTCSPPMERPTVEQYAQDLGSLLGWSDKSKYDVSRLEKKWETPERIFDSYRKRKRVAFNLRCRIKAWPDVIGDKMRRTAKAITKLLTRITPRLKIAALYIALSPILIPCWIGLFSYWGIKRVCRPRHKAGDAA